MRQLKSAWRRHPVVLTAFLLACAVFVFFAVRMTFAALYWADPARQNQTLEGWMTPGYVARSWDVPRETVLTWLGDAAPTGGRKTLAQIAQDTGVPLAQIIDQLHDALSAQKPPE